MSDRCLFVLDGVLAGNYVGTESFSILPPYPHCTVTVHNLARPEPCPKALPTSCVCGTPIVYFVPADSEPK